MHDGLDEKTIRDFGRQWNVFTTNEGFYGSTDLFDDAFSLLDRADVDGAVVVDIGSGTGRIVRMLLSIGAKHVIAVEPSRAFDVLQRNLANHADQVTCLNIRAEILDLEKQVDLVVSYGVFHHMPDPIPAVQAACRCLKPGGKICLWLYGKEGNRLFLAFVRPVRFIATKLPHALLVALCWSLYLPLMLYLQACRLFPLPLHDYITRVIAKLSPEQRRLVIYDQLNPAYAKYYTGDEACELLRQGGFTQVQRHHRHGYSWTVVGVKPAGKK